MFKLVIVKIDTVLRPEQVRVDVDEVESLHIVVGWFLKEDETAGLFY